MNKLFNVTVGYLVVAENPVKAIELFQESMSGNIAKLGELADTREIVDRDEAEMYGYSLDNLEVIKWQPKN